MDPAGAIAAAPVNYINPDETGTILGATTGQALGVAPIVDQPAQIETVTTADMPEAGPKFFTNQDASNFLGEMGGQEAVSRFSFDEETGKFLDTADANKAYEPQDLMNILNRNKTFKEFTEIRPINKEDTIAKASELGFKPDAETQAKINDGTFVLGGKTTRYYNKDTKQSITLPEGFIPPENFTDSLDQVVDYKNVESFMSSPEFKAAQASTTTTKEDIDKLFDFDSQGIIDTLAKSGGNLTFDKEKGVFVQEKPGRLRSYTDAQGRVRYAP